MIKHYDDVQSYIGFKASLVSETHPSLYPETTTMCRS